MLKATTTLCGIATLCAFTSAALAQGSFPSSTIRIVVPTAPSGFSDSLSRLVAQKLSSQMKVSVVVENKAGASGNIGTEYVARANPDGYTLLTSGVNQVLSHALGGKLSYDFIKDLAPITVTAYSPSLLTINPSVPAKSVSEFIAYVRANPNKLSYGAPGIGNINHLAALLFLQKHGLSAIFVPYKGGAPMRVDLVAGRIQFANQSVTASISELRSNRLKALAIASPKRSTLLPDVPTMKEAGVKDFEVGVWYGFSAPAKTPTAIVERLGAEIRKAMEGADVEAQMAKQGTIIVNSTPKEAMAYTRRELEQWTKVIEAGGVKGKS